VENVLLTEAYNAVLVSSLLVHKYSLTYVTAEEEIFVFKNVVILSMERKDDIPMTAETA
jgi:hypothetical protein